MNEECENGEGFDSENNIRLKHEMPIPWLGVVLMINFQPLLRFQHLKQ